MTTSTNTPRQPVFKANIGSVQCSVWQNTSTDGSQTYYSTDIVRSYKDKDGNWKTGSNFNHDDLLNVAKLAERAESYIAKQKQLQS